ncbi:hypothetical protein BC828DRAFT_385704 [Blastocladiella britannica]|nr:hypothetical protein BC828DRAFT_385704 [Blastocladiella britannica]
MSSTTGGMVGSLPPQPSQQQQQQHQQMQSRLQPPSAQPRKPTHESGLVQPHSARPTQVPAPEKRNPSGMAAAAPGGRRSRALPMSNGCDPLSNAAMQTSHRSLNEGPAGPAADTVALTAAQSYAPRRIWVYRNGDAHYPGRRFLVNHKRFRNFEQFLATLTGDIGLRSGAVRKVYTVGGQRVASISDLADNAAYVAAGNEIFRTVDYAQPPAPPDAATRGRLLEQISKDRRALSRVRSVSARAEDAESHGDPEAATPAEKPLFKTDSKGYRVVIFRNGDHITPPARMVLSHRNCSSFDQLMNEVTDTLRLKEGRVKRLFDAESLRRIRSLHDLHDGQNLIASGTNHPQPVTLPYPKVDFTQQSETRRATQMLTERGKVITVYPNGDALHTGVKVTVTQYRFKELNRLLSHLASEVPLYSGRATHLCQLDGTRVVDLQSLVGHGSYVLVAGTDPFRHVLYNSDGVKKVAPSVAVTNTSMSRANEVLERSKRLLEQNGASSSGPQATGPAADVRGPKAATGPEAAAGVAAPPARQKKGLQPHLAGGQEKPANQETVIGGDDTGLVLELHANPHSVDLSLKRRAPTNISDHDDDDSHDRPAHKHVDAPAIDPSKCPESAPSGPGV